ncbi:hypothetical protein PSTG_12143 [Puccinia striiformis f. sp. tritici PST-78]|uniref:Uncharacterized protein n=1 Tax=Puccinia striiformis f. sp. tritici PST-78 TaxID=1165861 RepID=A0A0L0V5F9_9BASI|nr:hypothetical protein PSTG_12143 [Puccinia striiformis f. sp. tritici PST-78]
MFQHTDLFVSANILKFASNYSAQSEIQHCRQLPLASSSNDFRITTHIPLSDLRLGLIPLGVFLDDHRVFPVSGPPSRHFCKTLNPMES